MKKEHVAIAILGAFGLTYLLDAVSDPLPIPLTHPYQFLNTANFTIYPFTTASIFIRALAILAIPFLIFAFLQFSAAAKGGFMLLLAVLMQLYAVQRIATNSDIVPLEWALSLAFAGAVLTLFGIYYLIIGAMVHTHKKMRRSAKSFETYKGEPGELEEEDPNATPEWIEEEKR